MPFLPGAPIMTIDVDKIHNIDTRNVENLFGMWSVFSRCADSLQDGKRYENLSWRLWTRETFCCAPEKRTRLSHPGSVERRDHRRESKLPQLSSSVDSIATDNGKCFGSDTSIATTPSEMVRPEIRRLDSIDRCMRGNEKHITPIDLEKMVISIKENRNLEPLSSLSMPKPLSLPTEAAAAASTVPKSSSVAGSAHPLPIESSTSTVATENSTADTAFSPVTSEPSTTSGSSAQSVVRGFELGRISSSYRSSAQLAPKPTPILKLPHAKALDVERPKKKTGMFMLGGSSEEESSLDNHMSFVPGRSSLSEGLKGGATRLGNTKKKASFKDEVVTRTYDRAEKTHDEEYEGSTPNESAIEDDDEEDWEDSVSESARSSFEEKPMFPRVDSRPNLTSRRSLLTTLMHESDRAAALQNKASRSTPAIRRSRTSSPNGPSVPASPSEESPFDMERSRASVMTTSNPCPRALSPRTTRRNMLSTEMTESLRKHLLWERKIKNLAVDAGIRRRHTSHDVKTLQQFPESDHANEKGSTSKEPSRTNSFNPNQFFDYGLGEYHQRGW